MHKTQSKGVDTLLKQIDCQLTFRVRIQKASVFGGIGFCVKELCKAPEWGHGWIKRALRMPSERFCAA